MGQAEIQVAQLHTADAPDITRSITHGYAQKRHALPGIQKRYPLCPEAAAGESVSVPRHDLPVAGDQGSIQLRVPAIVKLQAVSSGGIHRSPKTGDGTAGVGGSKTGISEIHSRTGGFGC